MLSCNYIRLISCFHLSRIYNDISGRAASVHARSSEPAREVAVDMATVLIPCFSLIKRFKHTGIHRASLYTTQPMQHPSGIILKCDVPARRQKDAEIPPRSKEEEGQSVSVDHVVARQEWLIGLSWSVCRVRLE